MKTTLLLTAAVLVGGVIAGSPAANFAGQPAKSDESAKSEANVVTIDHSRLNFVQERTLASGQAGVLKFVLPKEGSTVKANTIIAGLQDDVAKEQLDIAKHEATNTVDIEYAEKTAAVAESELKKSRAANAEVPGTVPGIEIERLVLAYEKSKLSGKVAEHKKTAAEKTENLRAAELKMLQVMAPFDGVVTEVYKHEGEAVGNGEPILKLVNPNLIRAEARVPFEHAVALSKGNKVEVELNVGGSRIPTKKRTLTGKITFIDLKVLTIGDVRMVKVWAELTNTAQFPVAGLTGKMRIYKSKK